MVWWTSSWRCSAAAAVQLARWWWRSRCAQHARMVHPISTCMIQSIQSLCLKIWCMHLVRRRCCGGLAGEEQGEQEEEALRVLCRGLGEQPTAAGLASELHTPTLQASER